MDFSEIWSDLDGFFFGHPLVLLILLVGLSILVYMKPKRVLRTCLIIMAFCVIAYLLYYIGGATVSGVLQKEKLIHSTP